MVTFYGGLADGKQFNCGEADLYEVIMPSTQRAYYESDGNGRAISTINAERKWRCHFGKAE